MHWRLTIFLGIVVTFTVFCANAQDLAGLGAIKIDTRFVSVPVIVSDRNGRYVPNLKVSDFTVFQDGLRQNIDFFAATEEPLTIALLIDTSQSAHAVLSDVKDSARSLIKRLGPKDRAMVVTFDHNLHILSGLTSDQRQLESSISMANVPDRQIGSIMRDAVYQTVVNSLGGLKGRKAIILLTDGKDARSRIGADELVHRLEESDTLVYTIMFKTNGYDRQTSIILGREKPVVIPLPQRNPRRNERGERVDEMAEDSLRRLSDLTGGRFYSSKDGKLKKTFSSIIDDLRFQYRLGYYQSGNPDGKLTYDIRIVVARPDAIVRARRNYRISQK